MGDKEGEEHRCKRETSISCLSHACRLGTKPATQACALTGNRTGDLSLCGTMPNPLSHTGQGLTANLNTLIHIFYIKMGYTLPKKGKVLFENLFILLQDYK